MSRTRAIVLCSPNNPTGAIYPPATLAAFHEIARRQGVALVLDETYKDFRAEAGPAHGLFADRVMARKLRPALQLLQNSSR